MTNEENDRRMQEALANLRTRAAMYLHTRLGVHPSLLPGAVETIAPWLAPVAKALLDLSMLRLRMLDTAASGGQNLAEAARTYASSAAEGLTPWRAPAEVMNELLLLQGRIVAVDDLVPRIAGALIEAAELAGVDVWGAEQIRQVQATYDPAPASGDGGTA